MSVGSSVGVALRTGVRAVTAEYVLDGVRQHCGVSELGEVALEETSPMRTFPDYPHKRNYSGSFYSAVTGGHVVFESLFERSVLMVLEYDSDVVAVAAQPVGIRWPGVNRRPRVPDFFLRYRSGEGVLVDARPAELIDDRARRSFDATAQVCAEAGLGYRVVSDLPVALRRNLMFLANFRDDVFAEGDRDPLTGWEGTLAQLAAVLHGEDRASGFGAAYRMLWAGQARTDLRQVLTGSSVVRVVA